MIKKIKQRIQLVLAKEEWMHQFEGSDGSKKSNHDRNAGDYNAHFIYLCTIAEISWTAWVTGWCRQTCNSCCAILESDTHIFPRLILKIKNISHKNSFLLKNIYVANIITRAGTIYTYSSDIAADARDNRNKS